jgi:hypothetical protein
LQLCGQQLGGGANFVNRSAGLLGLFQQSLYFAALSVIKLTQRIGGEFGIV